MPLPSSWQFDAFGTQWSIDTEVDVAQVVKDDVTTFLARYDQAYSRFRDDSLVAKIYATPGTYTFDEGVGVDRLLDFYNELYTLTDGAVTPLVGELLSAAGYDKTYSLTPQRTFPSVEQLPSMISRTGSSVTTKQPVMIDVGAAGKGHAVDLLAPLLARHGIENYLIDASGDMLHHSDTMDVIGLEDPRDTSKVIGTIPLDHKALCASAINRRAWAGLHHVFDARTSRPTDEYIATWVIADSAMVADGCATALFFIENTDEIVRKYKIDYVRMHKSGTIDYNNTLQGKLTLFN